MDMLKTIWLTIIYEYRSPSNIGGILDLVVIAVAVILVLAAFVYCVKYFVFPGEKEENHIKRMILKDNSTIDKRSFYD